MSDETNIWSQFGAAMAAASRHSSLHTYFYHTNDPDAQLSYAHYSDPHFDGQGAVIYGTKAPCSEGVYIDRIWQWDHDRAQAASDAMREQFGEKSCARRVEGFLSHYYGRTVSLKYIIAGTRADNGYSWHYYGFDFVDEQE